MNTNTATNTAKDLASLNQFNQNYSFKTSDYFNKSKFDFNAEGDRIKETIQKDFNLLKEYEKAFLSRGNNAPIVGDALLLPTGETVYFCHVWDDSVQTCGGGSFSLTSSGFLSYSGGLDSGIKKHDIYLTDDFTALNIWFCHRGYLTGGCSIDAYIKTRIWKCKENADLSGIPQIERYFAKIEEDKAEKITRINGNDQEYILPCPVLKVYNPTPEEVQRINKALNLELININGRSYYSSQLMTVKQYEKAQKIEGFKADYHNGCHEKNTLVLTSNKFIIFK